MKPIVAAFIIGIISGYYVAGLADAEIAPSPDSPVDVAELHDEAPNAVTQNEGSDAVSPGGEAPASIR
ncbi:MAG: hypothetical protein RLZZ234_804 [Candidatus Parcubacteria bacterium]